MNTPAATAGLLRAREVAAYLGVSTGHLYKMRQRGQLPPARRVAGIGLCWPRGELDAWIAAQPRG